MLMYLSSDPLLRRSLLLTIMGNLALHYGKETVDAENTDVCHVESALEGSN